MTVRQAFILRAWVFQVSLNEFHREDWNFAKVVAHLDKVFAILFATYAGQKQFDPNGYESSKYLLKFVWEKPKEESEEMTEEEYEKKLRMWKAVCFAMAGYKAQPGEL